ncbi:MAG: rhomboid family intramembrane serine protease [Planctomycetota bacterium]
MGYDDREYFQPTDSLRKRWTLNWIFIYASVAVFVAAMLWQYVIFRGSTLSIALLDWSVLKPVNVIEGFQEWRLLTHLFLDISPLSLLFNMLALYWFGNDLEELVGTRSYALLFAGGALVSALTFVGLGYLIWPGSMFTGPSGALIAVMVAAAITWPDRQVICLFFPVKLKYLVLIWIGLDVYTSITVLGVASLGHLAGAVWAFGYWKLKDRVADRLETMDNRAEIRADRKEREHVMEREAEIDEILKKISVSGINSLTERERRVLEVESEKKRSR